jgi:cytoskeletal protein CcmA (bactofilin family)
MLDLKTVFDPAALAVDAPGDSVIGPGAVLRGDVEAMGRVHLFGQLYGEVRADRVCVEPGGALEGVVEAGAVEVHGRLAGSVKAGEVHLFDGAQVAGDIVYESLTIDPGAVLDGRCFPLSSLKA